MPTNTVKKRGVVRISPKIHKVLNLFCEHKIVLNEHYSVEIHKLYDDYLIFLYEEFQQVSEVFETLENFKHYMNRTREERKKEDPKMVDPPIDFVLEKRHFGQWLEKLLCEEQGNPFVKRARYKKYMLLGVGLKIIDFPE